MAFEDFDLWRARVPAAIVDLVPESVARENIVMPVGLADGRLWFASSSAHEDLRDKLRFILNCNVQLILRPRAQILHAIELHYGSS